MNYSQGVWSKYLYITDGRGRLFAFTDTSGNDMRNHVTYFQNGGNQAGAIHRSTSFANSRAEAPTQGAGLSFYRNRYYDQNTGRWIQEDPIGIAGGVNLYAYAGNNPATFTDPFGICPPDDDIVSDCPNSSLGRAWRKLNETQEGRATIKRYVNWRPAVDTVTTTCRGRNCTSPDRSTVHVSAGNPAQVAIGLTHEIEHVEGSANVMGSPAIVLEELAAWGSAFTVYESFSRRDRSQSGYGDEYAHWTTYQADFVKQVKCAYAPNLLSAFELASCPQR